jgi:hypothetical protein
VLDAPLEDLGPEVVHLHDVAVHILVELPILEQSKNKFL